MRLTRDWTSKCHQSETGQNKNMTNYNAVTIINAKTHINPTQAVSLHTLTSDETEGAWT